MTDDDQSELGLEVEAALNEVLAHVRGEIALPTRLIDAPASADIRAVRKKLGLTRRRFAERFRLDPRRHRTGAGRARPIRQPVLLTVIEREPEAVDRALTP